MDTQHGEKKVWTFSKLYQNTFKKVRLYANKNNLIWFYFNQDKWHNKH